MGREIERESATEGAEGQQVAARLASVTDASFLNATVRLRIRHETVWYHELNGEGIVLQ